MVLLGAEPNPLVAELSEPNKSPNRSGPDACRDEPTLELTPDPDPILKGSNKSPTAAKKHEVAEARNVLKIKGKFSFFQSA